MGLFKTSKSGKQAHGQIGYYKLSDWWYSEFSERERKIITEVYQPMGGGGYLVKGNMLGSNHSKTYFLSNLASWFNNPNNRGIAVRIMKKAEETINDKTTISDLHFLYQHKLEIYYKQRNDDPNSLDIAIDACKKQIEIAPQAAKYFKEEQPRSRWEPEGFMPSHKGFTQLVIIEEKRGNYQEAISLAKTAKSQGWRGDWDKRILRCEKKIK